MLLDIARKLFPDIEAVFVNTGLEYPEIQRFVKSFDNVTILRPEMSFIDVITKYGYPMISKEVAECVSQGRIALERNDGTYSYRLDQLNGTAKTKDGNKSPYNKEKYKPLLYTNFIISHNCCNIMKKKPVKTYAKKSDKKPITAQMADESALRTQKWLQNGCNAFNSKSPISNPMSFWTEQDVLEYIKIFNIPIASVYGTVEQDEKGKYYTTGCKRTGCIFCGFGCHLEKEPTRFQRLKETHPKQYKYCLDGGEFDEMGIWKPNKQGLGMKYVFDEMNKIYGEGFIKY